MFTVAGIDLRGWDDPLDNPDEKIADPSCRLSSAMLTFLQVCPRLLRSER
jgi:hypothetical protein